MKLIRIVLFLLFVSLFLPLQAGAQNLATYRGFSFGMTLTELHKQIDPQELRTKLIQANPSVVQEVTWWPWEFSGLPLQGDGLWQILFEFHNGQLYRMLAIYDRHATRGLTAEDMIEAISVQYGTPARSEDEVSFRTNGLYRSTEKVLAQWEDSQHSYTLFRSSLSDAFGLVMFSKRLDAQADLAMAASAKLVEQEAPQKETVRRSQEAEELEVARQKNKKAIRP